MTTLFELSCDFFFDFFVELFIEYPQILNDFVKDAILNEDIRSCADHLCFHAINDLDRGEGGATGETPAESTSSDDSSDRIVEGVKTQPLVFWVDLAEMVEVAHQTLSLLKSQHVLRLQRLFEADIVGVVD